MELSEKVDLLATHVDTLAALVKAQGEQLKLRTECNSFKRADHLATKEDLLKLKGAILKWVAGAVIIFAPLIPILAERFWP